MYSISQLCLALLVLCNVYVFIHYLSNERLLYQYQHIAGDLNLMKFLMPFQLFVFTLAVVINPTIVVFNFFIMFAWVNFIILVPCYVCEVFFGLDRDMHLKIKVSIITNFCITLWVAKIYCLLEIWFL